MKSPLITQEVVDAISRGDSAAFAFATAKHRAEWLEDWAFILLRIEAKFHPADRSFVIGDGLLRLLVIDQYGGVSAGNVTFDEAVGDGD